MAGIGALLYDGVQPDAPPPQPMSGFSMFLLVFTCISFVIMIPSAIATWYSRCYKQTLAFGFMFVFAPWLLALFSLLFPEDIRPYFIYVMSIIISVVTIYATYLQFTGQCNLGFK